METGEFFLDGCLQVEEFFRNFRLFAGHHASHLPEERGVLAGAGSQFLVPGAARDLAKDLAAGGGHFLSQPRQNGGGFPFDIVGKDEVADEKIMGFRKMRTQSFGSQLSGPDFPRDIGADAAAVPLAVDVAGTVPHFAQGIDGLD